MDDTIKEKILHTLNQNRLMAVSTLRADGWPQVTTVGYVNDGLDIYFLCGPQSQKAENIARDARISLAIASDTSNPMAIEGLSMAAYARRQDNAGAARLLQMLPWKFPEFVNFPAPKPEEIAVFRVEPKIISVIDYAKGFGHTDLVTLFAA